MTGLVVSSFCFWDVRLSLRSWILRITNFVSSEAHSFNRLILVLVVHLCWYFVFSPA